MRSLSVALLLVICAAAAPARAQHYRDPDEAKFTVSNLRSINTDADEYAPFVTANGRWIYFTTSRVGSSDLFRARRAGSEWGNPGPIPPDPTVNTALDDGSLSGAIPPLAQLFELSDHDLAGLYVPELGVFTSGKRSGGAGDADLYLVTISRDGERIREAAKLPSLNTSAWEAQGTIASDGSFIIFSSNRSGGSGGMDLYIANRTAGGGYSDPVNLGENVNSSANECAPFIAPDGRTLYFASTRQGGFGGSDLYMVRRDSSGAWGMPKNLGERINTSANELFFFGVGRAHCYFASDRPGGVGGLDLYEASPNIFAPGNSLIRFSLNDTTRHGALPGHIRIMESSLGRAVAELDLSGSDTVALPLLSGFSYRVQAAAAGFPERELALADFPGDTTINFPVNFGHPPAVAPPAPVFNFTSDMSLPFFVSGYYRMNTAAMLADLRKRQLNGDLKSQTFIADVARDAAVYEESRRLSGTVEKILGDFVVMCQGDYFPKFLAYLKERKPTDPKEYLEITIYGYADPRPIIGVYNEKPVTFLDTNGREVTVSPGDPLDNFKLAGLRAHYAVEYFDGLFRSSPKMRRDYISLADQGLIRWRAISESVDAVSGEDLGTKRRIKASIRKVREGESGGM
ncbi:MAG: Immunogenic 75 kDa protein [Chlorobi bacterium]|nr:Immunogenic 75 kDa protein [Chlorobiota bacterium]